MPLASFLFNDYLHFPPHFVCYESDGQSSNPGMPFIPRFCVLIFNIRLHR